MSEEKTQPLVSIIIPVYNGAEYMREAIDSALAQTYKNCEILVVNDGSCDEGKTDEIARSYGEKIRYFQKENGGVSTALNFGIANMRGEYFSWLSHDDSYAPEKIEKQVALLEKFQDKKTIALCESDKMDKDSKPFNEGWVGKKLPENTLIGQDGFLSYLFKNGAFNGCSLLIPKTAFDECGGFDERMRYSQDMFMWLKFALAGYSLVYEKETLSFMRMHGGQLTQRGIEIYHKDCETMSEYLIPALIKFSDKKRNHLYEYAVYNAKYNTPAVWKRCVKEGKPLIGFFETIGIWFVSLYGGVRPLIRQIYLKLFKKL